MAAQMRAKCDAKDYETLLSYMLAPSKPLLDLLKQLGIHAVTDITGFGLAGHLIEMLKSSAKKARLHLESVPIMPGVEALFQQGLESTLALETGNTIVSFTVITNSLIIPGILHSSIPRPVVACCLVWHNIAFRK